jgi:hypothetical protein
MRRGSSSISTRPHPGRAAFVPLGFDSTHFNPLPQAALCSSSAAASSSRVSCGNGLGSGYRKAAQLRKRIDPALVLIVALSEDRQGISRVDLFGSVGDDGAGRP